MDAAEAYELRAYRYLRDRDWSPIGARVVGDWARGLPRGARVIDLGCGGGYPVSRVLDAAGLQLWAVDSSATLLAAFRSRFPDIPVQCARVQESDFFGRQYDAAIAVGLLFLLSEQDQGALIARVSDIVAPGGRFLFTAPVQTGTWDDRNTGIECLSLGQARYTGLLGSAGFRVVARYTDKGRNNYYDAERTRPTSHMAG